MHPDGLQDVNRLLVVSCDRDVAALIPALSVLQQMLPSTRLTLLTLDVLTLDVLTSNMLTPDVVRSSSPSGVIEPTHLLMLDIVSIADWGINLNTLMHESRQLIHKLSDRAFDVAIIFTTLAQSPHTWGYLCYLAGIPIRIGQSQEFGGGVLSLCVTPPLDTVSPSDYHLHLVRSLDCLIPEESRLSLVF